MKPLGAEYGMDESPVIAGMQRLLERIVRRAASVYRPTEGWERTRPDFLMIHNDFTPAGAVPAGVISFGLGVGSLTWMSSANFCGKSARISVSSAGIFTRTTSGIFQCKRKNFLPPHVTVK